MTSKRPTCVHDVLRTYTLIFQRGVRAVTQHYAGRVSKAERAHALLTARRAVHRLLQQGMHKAARKRRTVVRARDMARPFVVYWSSDLEMSYWRRRHLGEKRLLRKNAVRQALDDLGMKASTRLVAYMEPLVRDVIIKEVMRRKRRRRVLGLCALPHVPRGREVCRRTRQRIVDFL